MPSLDCTGLCDVVGKKFAPRRGSPYVDGQRVCIRCRKVFPSEEEMWGDLDLNALFHWMEHNKFLIPFYSGMDLALLKPEDWKEGLPAELQVSIVTRIKDMMSRNFCLCEHSKLRLGSRG